MAPSIDIGTYGLIDIGTDGRQALGKLRTGNLTAWNAVLVKATEFL
ncbi:hypothetical protein [Leptothoe sp. PORK10 BA2]|nr:hypothetical protein [Leptothoe sp. PORK10 BA2]MEA5466156.1 hypothetical protein [Leptothoe sp. PORK10 BA2]